MSDRLERLRAAGVLSSLDVALTRRLSRLGGEGREQVLLAVALASRAVGQGHVCLDLGRTIDGGALRDEAGEVIDGREWPEIEAWVTALRMSTLVTLGVWDAPRAPLVLDDGYRLYLRRYWIHQERLADGLLTRAVSQDGVDDEVLRAGLRRWFATPAAGEVDWQCVAAATAVTRRLCVISGGPGTGKTHTVVRILALAIEQALARGRRPPRIVLMAPTGKAAARLQEAVRSGAGDLGCDPAVRAAMPAGASTIHRALGATPRGRTPFRHHHERPLRADLVVIDEASMVDLALMARVFDALPATAGVVLLGDQDQLASVEAGAVLGDICNSGDRRRLSTEHAARLSALTGAALTVDPQVPAVTGIGDSIVQLQRTYRFNEGIARLAQAVNAGKPDEVWAVLDDADEVSWHEPGADGGLGAAGERLVLERLADFAAAGSPVERLAALERFRVLCAHRRGPGGVEAVNEQIEQLLAAHGVLRLDGRWYVGRPILITRNDYQLRLFNGDVGIIVADPDDATRRQALFVGPDGNERRLTPARLPPHETVFAMSVHKSQGSELDAVAVLLPPEPSPVVSRELLYTAVSRARSRAAIIGPKTVVEHAVTHAIARASGLRDRLWGRKRRMR